MKLLRTSGPVHRGAMTLAVCAIILAVASLVFALTEHNSLAIGTLFLALALIAGALLWGRPGRTPRP